MTWTFVREDPEILAKNRARAAAERTNVDWSGIALLSTCLASTEFVIEEGQRRYWFEDSLIRVLTFVAVTTLAAFVVRQLTAAAPVMNLRLLKDARFATGMVFSVFVMCTLMATMFLLSVFMQQARGFSAMQAGLATLPMMLAMFVVMPIAGAVYERFSPRLTMAAGLCSGLRRLRAEPGHPGDGSVGPGPSAGHAGGRNGPDLRAHGDDGVLPDPRHLLADAAGLSNVLKETGGAIGLALFTSVLLRARSSARRAGRARGHDQPARGPAAVHAAGVTPGRPRRPRDRERSAT